MPDDRVLEVRSATTQDVDAVVRVTVRAYANERGWVSDSAVVTGERTSADQVRAMIDVPRSVILVAERYGAVVASCHVQAEGAEIAHLGMLAVDPGWQARGFSRLLRTAACDYARDVLDCACVEIEVLSTHEDLRRMYERDGFTATGETRAFPPHAARVAGLCFVVLRKRL
ncbi:GNAT family N-acetyltransferase [Curtobacterium poinsettiae]|uniref:GNAT family N-acetyltransferase n=1 Tax=Curtobacterium poinsettiae TaxID=159612 RepID=UPI002360E6EA|nr:GNAT family N-acetyltransferase [Curtobacterium flaccumfaciens]MDD1386767.1 GNAT family N-acetyltransferase [Curtobacterium flaccumfaciens pv. poinsettiae]